MPHSVHPTPRCNTPDYLQQQQQHDIIGGHWWNINQPESQWTEECPEFLVGQSAKNMSILSRSRDEERPRFNWEDVQRLAKTNQIHHFERTPSALRAYLEYIHHLKKTYGSVLAFIQHERLHWDDVVPSSTTGHFSDPADFKVLYNDWPYHIDQDITHLILWTKWQMEDEPATEEPTVETRREIDEFITRTLCSPRTGADAAVVSRDRIVWFKNWKSLKSVHALEHVHIMLYQAPPDLLERVTQGDRPISESWTGAGGQCAGD